MVRWLKIEELEKTEDFDRETGETIFKFQVRVTADIAIPTGLEDEALDEYLEYVNDEALYGFESWFEQHIFSRLEGKYDYQIIVLDNEEIQPINIISSPSKEKGTLILICNPDDLVDIVGKGLYRELLKKITTRKHDPDKVRLIISEE